MEEIEYIKKILLVGDGAVGKTSLVRKYVHDIFSDKYIATIGTKTTRKVMEFDYQEQGVKVKLDLGIWDILGQEGIEHSHQVYFTGADGFIAVCDLSRPDTIDSLKRWSERVRQLCGPIPAVIAANKADLVPPVASGPGPVDAVAAEIGAPSFRTSAKNGDNVEKLFYEMGVFLCWPIVEKYVAQRDGAASPKKRRGFGARSK